VWGCAGLTRGDLQHDVGVVPLHHRGLLVLQHHAAVSALVGVRDVLQRYPEVLLPRAVGERRLVAVVSRVVVARAQEVVTALLAVGREQPAVFELVFGVQLDAPQRTHQLGGGALGAEYVEVGGGHLQRLRAVGQRVRSCMWEEGGGRRREEEEEEYTVPW